MTEEEARAHGSDAIKAFRGVLIHGWIFLALNVLFTIYLLDESRFSMQERETTGYMLTAQIIIFLIGLALIGTKLVKDTMSCGIQCKACGWRALIIPGKKNLELLISLNSCPKCKGQLFENG